MRPELELVWSGQRGVYVGACLRCMESYATRPPLPRGETEAAPDEFRDMTIREALLHAFHTYGPQTRLSVVRMTGKTYTAASSALDRLCQEGLVEDTGQMQVAKTGGRPARVYGVPRETR